MKKIVSVLVFSLSAASLSALPEGCEVSSGQADLFVVDEQHLRITVSDQAILRHKSFHIKEGEFVEFVQPSSKSTVLNRVVGQDPSRILGKLSSNGRLFLINPNGICFGPNAVVNTGSFLASTLNIRDEDFLNGEYKFFVDPGSENSKILNEGTVSVAPEGFAAFLSPFIENRGSILAKAGRVLLASAEKVTIDFSGDGLIQFAVEGDLERALIESSGDILAVDGLVDLSMRAAHRAIKMVVNTEGITPANQIEEVDGVIRLVSRSRIAADSVRVDSGSNGRLDVQGSVDASHYEKGGVGGSITLLGDQVVLSGANLDASGDAGGGEVLVGGNYQGKGPEANAAWTSVDADSIIRADACSEGNGGRVIVWADETAVFDGKIYARGGVEGGDGGFVETSGEQNLSVTTGNVNTLAPKGKVGSWLMDPSSITIVRNNGNQGAAGLTTAATCSGGGFNLNDTTINNAASTVVLCTAGLIRYNNGAIINITTPGVGITHGAASTPSNTTFQTGAVNTWSITTNNGPLTFNGPVTIPSTDTMSFTTAGGNVSFASTINGAGPAVINAGAGTTTFTGAVGATTALTSLTVTAATITQSSTVRSTGAISYTGATAINVGGNMTTAGATIGLTGPVTISGNPTIDSTNAGGTAAGATITFSSTLNGVTALTLRAGTAGNVIFTGIVGGTAPPTNISFTSAAQARVGNNITVSGANTLNFSVPVLVTGTSNITSNNASVTFGTTLDGSPALTITGGSGTTTFTGAVGGTTSLASLNATAATITQSSTAKTVGALNYTGATAINVSGNITTTGGVVGLTGPVAIAGAPTIDTTNAGGTPAGATITFSSTLNGATTLALRAGTGGNVIFTGAVGGSAPPTNITFTSAAQAQIGNNFTVSGANPLNFSVPVLMTGTSTVTSNNANVTFGSTLDGAAALSVAGGSGITTFSGAVGSTTPLSSLSATAATITQSSTAKTTGAIGYTGSTAINVNGNMTTAGGTVGLTGPVTIVGSPTIDTTNAGGTPAGATITFSSTLNGATALTLRAGTAGNVIFTGVVGGSAPPTNITFTSAAQVQIDNNISVSGANPLNISIPALLTGTSLITSNNANVSFGSTLNGAQGLTVAGGSGTTTLSGAVGGTTPLSSLSITAATITQSSTAKTTGAISYSGSTAINLGGNLTTSGSTIGFTGPVNITASLTADTTNGGAISAGNSLSFSSTIDGAVAYTQDLTLRAGTSGNITFTGAVGGTVPLRNLTITSANNWTAAAMTVATILQSAGSGTTTFNGLINTNGTAGIVLTGTTYNWNANITTTNTGPLTVTHTGTLTIGAGVTLNIDGPYSDLGPGATVYSGGFNIVTNGSNVTFSTPVNLNGASSVNTGAGVGDILFNSTVNGAQNLTLFSGLGNIVFSGGVGQTTPLNILSLTSANNVTEGALSAVSFSQAGGTGTTTLNGAVVLSGASGFTFTGNNLTINSTLSTALGGPANISVAGTLVLGASSVLSLDGAFTQSGVGMTQSAGSITTTNDNIQFGGTLVLTGNTVLNTGSGIGDINFLSTVEGTGGLTLTAGTGNVTFTGAAGGSTRLGALTIANAENVTTGSITAASITQTAGTGTSTLGSLNTNAVGGISLTGTAFSINGNLITTNLGPVAITNTGALVLVGGASTSITGAFTQSGGGVVGLAGVLLTANQNLSFAGATTLLGTTFLSTGAGAGTITFSSTVNGSQNLTLTAGTGNIVLGGAIGGSSALGALTVQSCTNITYPTTSASSVTQNASSGTTTLSSPITTTGTSGISLTGTTITQSSTLSSSGTGPTSITNSGTYTMGGTVTSSGSFTQSGGGPVQLNGSITSSTGNVTLANAITLTGSSSLSTNTGLGNILVSSTIDGANNLSLNAGGGTITLSGAVGGGTRVGVFTINSGVSNTTGAITAASISQVTGSTTFGALNTNGALGISLTGTSFTLSGNVTTTALGPVSIQNTGALVLSGPTFSIAGAFTQAGAGTTMLSSAITAGGAIQFGGPITASGSPSLDASAAGANITLLSTVDGGGNLTLDAGMLGDISIVGNVGSVVRLGALVFTNANNITVQNITAASLHQVDGQGTSSYQSINTNAIGGIIKNGTNFVRNGSIVTTNGGPLHLTNSGTFTTLSGTSATIDGQYLQDGLGGVLIQGTITTNNQPISFAGPITLTDPFSLNSGAGAGDITLSNTVDGAFNFTLTAGTGSITASSAIGGISRIGAFTVNSCTNFTGTGLTAASVSITETGGTVQSNGSINTNSAAGIILNAQNIVRGGSVTATNGGPLTVTFSGTSTATGVFPINVGSLSITSTGVGAINFGGAVTTDTGGVDLNSPVNLLVPSSVNTSGPGGAIHFHSTVNGAQNITLTAGAGNVLFDGAVGGTIPLSAVLINSANNVTAAASISAASIVQSAGTGTTTFSGALTTTGATGISITTASAVRGAAITTTGTGPLTFALSSGGTLTSTASGAISLDGAFTETGAASVVLSGSITTTNDNISFGSPITLAGTTTLNSGAGAGNISVTTINGGQALNITAGTGDFTASGDLGNTTRLGALTINSCTNFSVKGMTLASLNLTETGGTSTFNGILNTNTVSGITINAGNIVQGGGVTATNGGPLTISFSGTNSQTGIFIIQVGSLSITNTGAGTINFGGSVITDTGGIDVHSPISFLAATSVNTSGPGENIHFFDTVNGSQNITFAAGTGNILFDAAVGNLTPPLTLTLSSANNVTAAAAVSTAAIVQTAGTGKTTFNGVVSTTTAAGISLTGSQFEIDGAVTTTNGGPLLVNNSGAFTFPGGGTIAGALTQTGVGVVSLGGTTTAGAAVSFASAVTLSGTTSLDTSANASNITFSSTLNGGQNLSLNLGAAGNLLFTGSVGGSTRLGALTIANAENVTSGSITAASITQTAGGGTSTLGSLNTNTIGGISLTGTAFSINGNLITTNLGPVAITNTGALVLVGGASTSITGAFTQSGGGVVGLAGLLLTANQNLSFAGATTLLGTTFLSTAPGAGTITFSSTVNGSQNLTLTAGTGNIVLGGAIGGSSALNALTVQSCTNITYPATSATSVTQNASSGTTTLSSPITTTGTSGISLTGTTITQSSTLSSSGTGPIAIINSGTYTMGGTITSGGSFTQSGGGPVHLNGPIASSTGNISVANAITLTGSSSLSTNTGSGNILVSSTIDGANALSLTAGGGTITISGAVGGGTRVGVFTIASGIANTTGAISAASISQVSGSTTFGALNTNGASGISLTGTNFTLGGNVTTTALGPVSIQNTGALVLSGSTFSIDGAFTQVGAGTTTLSSTIIANGPILFSGAASTSGSPSLDTSAGGQTITFLNTVNGPGGLTLNSGAGNITLAGSLGGVTRLGAFVISDANGVSALGIRAASIVQTMGTGTTSITGNLDTNAILGIDLSGVNFTINGSLLSTNGGPCTIDHTGLLTLNAGNSTLLSGPFTESGLGGTVTLSGGIHASNANVTFANPITLSGATTLNSNEGGDILISSTVDGPFDLVYTAGTGNITLAADIGGITPVTSLTVTTAANVTTQAISSGRIVQSSGTGLSQFNGVLTTTTAQGIVLAGNQFAFGAPVNTSGGGGVTIANAGLLSLPGAAPFSLDGAFSQTGAGPVSLCTTITTTGESISFSSPVTLCGNALLDTDSAFGGIQFASTVDGARNLVLAAGQGNIVFFGNIGSGTPLSLLQVNNCADFTAQSIHSAIIDIEGVSALGTCNGTLTTTNALGITLSGSAFTLNANITTSNAGPLAITNSGLLTIAPSLALSIDGPFTQTGIGTTDIGGTITTNAQPITFSGPIALTGDLALNSGNGNITFGTDIEGAHSVTITAGSGDVTVPVAFSITIPLVNFTVVSSHDISLEGVGSSSEAMTGTLSLTGSGTISLMGSLYSSHTQFYSSGADLDFINPGLMTLNTTGGPITFASASAHLNSATDLAINTNGGTFSFNAIHGTNFENLTINTGTGLASLGSLPNVGNINTVIVNAGQILLNGAMNLVNTDFTSLGSILNSGAPVDIVSANTASFNALGGNVGSLTSPILVHTQNQIYAGGIDLADFEGSSIDDTVHEIPSNPPCEIIWNGVVIKSCNRPNPPTPAPSPSNRIVFFGTPVPGVESSYFNLASDYYFMPYFLSDDYIRKPVLLYWRSPPPILFAEVVNSDYTIYQK